MLLLLLKIIFIQKTKQCTIIYSTYMYMYMYVYMTICMCVRVHLHTHICLHGYMYVQYTHTQPVMQDKSSECLANLELYRKQSIWGAGQEWWKYFHTLAH